MLGKVMRIKLTSMRGYTLMEFIVVLSVIGILSAVALPSFSTQIKENRLSSYANELHNLYKFARGEAASKNEKIDLKFEDEKWTVTVQGTTEPISVYEPSYDAITVVKTGSSILHVTITTTGAAQESAIFSISDENEDTEDYNLCIYISGQSTLNKTSEC